MTIPIHVALALATVYGPNERYEDFVHAYGTERGESEYEAQHGERDRAAYTRARKLVDQAREVAHRNGWEWEAILAAARVQLGVNESWRGLALQRTIDLRERAMDQRNEMIGRSDGLRDRNTAQWREDHP